MDLMPARRDFNGLKCEIGPQQERLPSIGTIQAGAPIVIIRLRNDDERRFGGFHLDIHGSISEF